MFGIFANAVSGLNDSILRIANAASNIVNASSSGKLPARAVDSSNVFAPQDVITISNSVGDNNLGVHSALVPRDPAYVTVRDPSSRDANAEGLVAAPNVDLNAEIVAANIAQTSYAANAAVIRIAGKLDKALLDIET